MIGVQPLSPQTPPPTAAPAELAEIGKDGTVAGTVADDGVWGRLDIDLQFIDPVDPDAAAAFSEAAAFWETRIPGYRLPGAAGETGLETLEVFVQIGPRDGPGGTLGSAGALATARVDGHLLPTSGSMNLDEADVGRLADRGTLEAVVRHELAHVLGFTDFFWADAGAVSGTGSDTSYTGAFALAAYRAEIDPDADFVPVEGLINGRVRPGTSYSHWDEELFADHSALNGDARNPELMTGTLHTRGLYVSDTTIASFADLGYAVDLDFSDHPADDFGADPAGAGTVAVNGSATGTLELAGDRDWFAVGVTAGRSYVFTLEGADGGGGSLADPLLRLLDAGGTPLAENDDAAGLDSRIAFTAAGDATLHLSAGAFADAGTGSYTLAVAEQPPLEINTDPVAIPDTAILAHGAADLIDVLANDTDAEESALALDAILTGPAGGSAAILGNRLHYTPDPGFSGTDSLVYRVSDGAGGTDTADLSVTVLAPPAPAEGVLRGTPEPDLLALAQGASYLGGAGPDTFLLSRALVPLETSLIEGDGPDRIELIAGLEIVQARIRADALELTLDTGAQVRLLNAAEASFGLGANATTGTAGQTLDYPGFAGLFGASVPAEGEVVTGGLSVPEAQAPLLSGADGFDFV